jgi:flagellar biosynthesis protein FlhB
LKGGVGMKKDTSLRIIIFSIIGLIILWLVKVLLFPANYYGFRLNILESNGGDHMYMNGNYGYGALSLSTVLVFLIKFLIILFVIALIVGLVMAAKNFLFNSQNLSAFKNSFTPVQKPAKICEVCGKTLEDSWKVCPYCAAEVKEK